MGLPVGSASTPVLGADFDGLADEVAALIDRAEITQALDVIWQRVRRLNRYVEEQAPWTLAKDPERAADLGKVLASLLEGLRIVTVLLVRPICRRPRRPCWMRSASTTARWPAPATGRAAAAAR